MLVNMENILMKERKLEIVGTGFVLFKIKSKVLVMLDVLKVFFFLGGWKQMSLGLKKFKSGRVSCFYQWYLKKEGQSHDIRQ